MEEMIMDLVSLIAEQVQTKYDLFTDEGRIMDSLMNSGYQLQEADAVLTFMQALAVEGAGDPADTGLSMRAMSTEERSRFTIEAFGFITKMTTLCIISADQREDIIEKALALPPRKLSVDEVKAIVAHHLLASSQEFGEFVAATRQHQGDPWN